MERRKGMISMRKCIVVASMCLSLISPIMITAYSYAEDVQRPVVAGQFYPQDKDTLQRLIDTYIDNADTDPVGGRLVALIVPHAGYPYSGSVAGYGFKLLKGRSIKTVVIIAPSHRYGFKGLAVLDKDYYQTPLGDAAIDRDVTKRLLGFDPRIQYHPQAFAAEHAAEVEIPFLQSTLKDFKIVVILTGMPDYDTCTLLRDSLSKVLANREDILLVISSDMSHYHPDAEARDIDQQTIAAVEGFDPEALFLKLSGMPAQDSPCGGTGMVGAMMAARNLGADSIKVLRYATSGDVTNDRSAVVGYFCAAIYKRSYGDDVSVVAKDARIEKENDMAGLLTKAQKRRLLEIARTTLESYIKEGVVPQIKEDDPILNKKMGAFVTLHKNGQLRGCIGNMIGQAPLCATISNMAIASSTQDPRFQPVTPQELKDIDIEISVLSPMEKIDSPDKIIMGKHGVMVQSGYRSGIYLPQVATETGWSREQFMSSLCMHKAGLPADAWKQGGCDIYIFSAEVFGEKEPGE